MSRLPLLPIEPWHWFAFLGLVVVLLTLDLCVFHRRAHIPSFRESAWFVAFWISMGLLFSALVWSWGWTATGKHEAGVKFLTGYVIEQSLSMDNIFVFVVIFRFFQIPAMYQYRVLFWGILGAIVMRLTFILGGVELFERFDWVGPIFGAFLLYSAYKLVRHAGTEVHPEKNVLLRLARRLFPVTKGDHREHGNAFFVREAGRLCITPMFLVLLVIESTDVIFAIDSVPAIIVVTADRFIAFTSNVFAVLGLRAMYFLLAGMVDKFRYLHYGLAAILGFVGLKMLADYFIAHEQHTSLIPPEISLAVVAAILAISIAASVLADRRDGKRNGPAE